MSSPGLPVMGPGMHVSGAHPHSGVYGVLPPPATRRGTGPRTGTIVIVVLVLVTWILIGVVWWTSRDDGRAGPGGAAPASAPGGVYRFADDQAPTSPPAPVSPAAQSSDTKDTKGKKPKKPKP